MQGIFINFTNLYSPTPFFCYNKFAVFLQAAAERDTLWQSRQIFTCILLFGRQYGAHGAYDYKRHEKGLTHICFTEHMDIDYPVSEETPAGTFLVNTDSYLYDLARFQDAYKDRLRILFGIELGLQPDLSKKLAAYAHAYEFDFIIGSAHIVNGKDPYYPAFYENRSEEAAYREYFESVIANIKKCSHFDVFGHLDYVVRYGPEKDKHYSYAKYQDLFDTILTLLLEKEKGIELNTGSLRSGTKDVSPCRKC